MEEQKNNSNAYLASAPIGKLMWKFSLPCVMSMVVSALYNIVDQVFIGNKIGYLGNAATTVVYPFTVIALALALLVGDGAAALVSLSLGRGDREKAARSVGNGMVMAVILGVVLMAIGFVFMEPLLNVFGATEACRGYAIEYMQIILIGIPFYMYTSAVNGAIRADASPRYAMIATVLGAVINLILDPVMIFGMNMGMRGAAWATIIGQIASCFVSLLYFRRMKTVPLTGRCFCLRGKQDGEILRLGISSFITQIAIVVVMAVANNMIAIYGPQSVYGADIPLSAIGIVMKVFAIVISISVGIAVGGQPILGYNYGAGNYARVRDCYRTIIRANLVVGLVAMLLFELCPQVIVRLFGAESALYNEYANLCFRVFLGGIVLCCVQKASSIFLQAIGKSMKAMLLSISRDVIFFVPGLLLLAEAGGVTGMLWAAPVADVLAVLLTLVLIHTEFLGMKKMQDLH